MIDNMDASYYPVKMKNAGGAEPSANSVPSSDVPDSQSEGEPDEEDSTIKFYPCLSQVSQINSQLDISPEVDQALRSALSVVPSSPDREELEESVQNPQIRQFQQAVHNLQNLDMLQRVATVCISL